MRNNFEEIHWVCPRCGGHWSESKGEIPNGNAKCPTCGGTYVETRYTEGEIYNAFRHGNGSQLLKNIKEEYVYSNEQYDPEEFQKWQDKRRGKEPFHSTYQSANTPKCPICQSTNLSKISTAKKAGKIALFGIFGMGDNGKTWKCNNCGSKF